MNDLIIPDEFLNKNLLKYKDLFEPQIRMRGNKYFREGNVHDVYKNSNSNSYVAKVEGEDTYTTLIEIKENGELQMSCTCPYWDNCKHEWATLLTINSGNYKEIELKPINDKQNISMEELLKKIPAGKLKKYIVSESFNDLINIDMDELVTEFFEYLPRNDYDYYYNSLFNAIEINDYYKSIINTYMIEIKQYIEIKEYNMSFNIIKAIIEISHDKEIDITEKIPQIGMFLRICFNKTKNDKKLVNFNKTMKAYINKVKRANYYDNVFIEDMIDSLK